MPRRSPALPLGTPPLASQGAKRPVAGDEARKADGYDCSKCPAYCCSIYTRIHVDEADIARLAEHFGKTKEETIQRYTKRDTNDVDGERILRRKKDPILGEACEFLNLETRTCGIYDARPSVCRSYPYAKRCAYFDMLQSERDVQEDPDVLPLIQITFPKWRA